MNEEQIIHRAQRGDSEAFCTLVEQYRDRVYRLAFRMCGGAAHLAEEAAQDAFVAAWRGLPNFQGKAQFSTWLYQLTTNAAIDLLRREKRHSGNADVAELELPDHSPTPQQAVERRERQQAVQKALAALSEEYREILLLRFMAQRDYAEIGAVLELPVGTVKSRLSRAKARLKEALLESGNIFGDEAVILTDNEGKEA